MNDRLAALVRAHDRCEGKLTLTEQRWATAILLEAFDIIDYAQGVRSWQAAKDRAAEWNKPTAR